MRHTRMRQIAKARGEETHSHLWRKEVGTNPMWFSVYWYKLGLKPTLDPTFKWHRDFHGMNIVSFNRKGESFKTYVIKGRK